VPISVGDWGKMTLNRRDDLLGGDRHHIGAPLAALGLQVGLPPEAHAHF
jgi:hypothetical protein